MHLKIHCTLKLLPLSTSVFLKGYLRPIFSLIVLNVFFVCLVVFFTGKYTACKGIEKKINEHLTIVKKYYYVMSFDF